MILGPRIRAYRTGASLSLRELADKAQISVSYLSQLERGEREGVSAEILSRLARALGVSISNLSCDTGPGSDLARETLDVHESLMRFYEDRGQPLQISPGDLRMLAGLRYRGLQPTIEADWEYLFLSIRRTIDPGGKLAGDSERVLYQ